jgi:hypothetical protein
LCAVAGIAWTGPSGAAAPLDLPAGDRLRTAVDRLALRLCAHPGEPLSHDLAGLARDVDEVGAAAIGVLAAGTDWRVG